MMLGIEVLAVATGRNRKIGCGERAKKRVLIDELGLIETYPEGRGGV
jgi:hypothetical protein